MKYIEVSLILLLFLSLMSPRVFAVETFADSSAALERENARSFSASQEFSVKKIAIRRVLNRYNSVLASESATFVEIGNKYNIDAYLLPSIAGLESYFAKYMINGTYNAYGWGSGTIAFDSWHDGIEKIGKTLREKYYDRGAKTVFDVGKIYAESPTWAVRVEFFMQQFYAEEARARQALTFL